jgi:high-affinity nickel-transport protein
MKILALFAALLGANAAAWLWAWTAFADRPALLGAAFLAWVFGLRHAADADHIAAIDNTVRKLMQDGRRPVTAGLWFSLGHASVVVAVAALIAVAAAAMQSRMAGAKVVGGLVGTSVSAAFLLAVAAVNVVILARLWRAFVRARSGAPVDEDDLNVLLAGRGLVSRMLRPMFRMITRSWHMFPLGLLFGLGFDTATEVGLLSISATQASAGLSPWSVLAFPALFAAGMALVDTADSAMMVGAYGWAFADPLRKLWYNITITAASVLVAVLVGGVEALGLIAGQAGLQGGVWRVISSLNDDLQNFGFAVIGVFAACWAVSAALYRWRGWAEAQRP